MANTFTFMVYALVKHPNIYDRVRREAVVLLSGPLDDARRLKEYTALYGLVLGPSFRERVKA